MYNSKDYEFEFYFKAFLIVIALIFITSCCESCSDTNEYNDGKCPYCGGTFVYDTAVGHRYSTNYIYVCDTCGRSIELGSKQENIASTQTDLPIIVDEVNTILLSKDFHRSYDPIYSNDERLKDYYKVSIDVDTYTDSQSIFNAVIRLFAENEYNVQIDEPTIANTSVNHICEFNATHNEESVRVVIIVDDELDVYEDSSAYTSFTVNIY